MSAPDNVVGIVSTKLNEVQRFVQGELKKLQETVLSTKAENKGLLEENERLDRENGSFKLRLQEQTEKVKQLRLQVGASEAAAKDAKDGKEAMKAPQSPARSPQTPRSAMNSPRGSFSSPARSPRPKKSAGDTSPSAPRRPPAATMVSPEAVQLIVSRLKAAAYTSTGSKIDASFFKRLDRDGSGEMDVDEWVKALRVEFRISPKELSDEQARHVFQELDMDGSNALAVDELALLVQVASSEKGAIDPNEKPSNDLPPSLLHRVVNRLRNAAHKDGGVQIDPAFFSRIDKEKKGKFDKAAWKEIVRKELKMSPMEIADGQIETLFNHLHNQTGFIEMMDLHYLVRAVQPETEKPKPGKAEHVKPAPHLSEEALKLFLAKIKQKAFQADGSVNMQFFNQMDRNNSGTLELTEFKNAMRIDIGVAQKDLPDSGVKVLFDMLDINVSGTVEIEELQELAKDIHELENKKLANVIGACRQVQNVCRLLAKSQQLNYKWEGEFFEAAFQSGTRVRICGLQARVDLNGAEATVIAFDELTWRFKVCLDDGQRMCFSPKNLRATDQALRKKPMSSIDVAMEVPMTGSPGVQLLKAIGKFIALKKERFSDFSRRLDKDADGSLTKKEMHTALENLGPDLAVTLTSAEMDDLMGIVDKDGGGEISVKELSRAIQAAMRGDLDNVESNAKLSPGAKGGAAKKERNSKLQ